MFHIYSDGTHAHAFIRRFFYFSDSFDAQTYFHTDKTDAESFAHRSFYLEVFARRKRLHTQIRLHAEAFTHRKFCRQDPFTQRFLYTDGFYTQQPIASSYTQNAYPHRCVCTKTSLHTDVSTHRCFDTQMPLHTDAATHRYYWTERTFSPRRFYARKPPRQIRHKEVAIYGDFC